MAEQGLLVLRQGIGNAVRNLRNQSKLSQVDVAERAKLSQSVVSRIEQGRANALDYLFKICDAMNVDIEMTFVEREPTDGLGQREQISDVGSSNDDSGSSGTAVQDASS